MALDLYQTQTVYVDGFYFHPHRLGDKWECHIVLAAESHIGRSGATSPRAAW